MRCLRGGKLASVNATSDEAANSETAAACWVVFIIVRVDGFDAVGKRQNRNGANDFIFLLVVTGIIDRGD